MIQVQHQGMPGRTRFRGGRGVIGGLVSISAVAAFLAATGSARIGELPESTTLHIDVVLAPRDPTALLRYATAVWSPGSPLYHAYIAHGRFASMFGPATATIGGVYAALRARGLHPGAISADHLSIPVTASAGQIENAFGIDMARYRLPGGGTGFANTNAPRPPASIAAHIQAVIGLDNLTRAHSFAAGPGLASARPTRSRPAGPSGEPTGGHIYWTDTGNGTIHRANLDGTSPKTLVSGQSNAFGVAVDSRHIYWANEGDGTIHRANLDGTGVTTLVSGSIYSGPAGVAVDSSHIYWANFHAGTIMAAKLDGTGVTTLVSGQDGPEGVAVDSSHIYWANFHAGTIMKARLDGTGVTTLVSSQSLFGPEGMAVDSSHIYWTNEDAGTISKANLDGTGVTTLVSGQVAGPAGVAVGPQASSVATLRAKMTAIARSRAAHNVEAAIGSALSKPALVSYAKELLARGGSNLTAFQTDLLKVVIDSRPYASLFPALATGAKLTSSQMGQLIDLRRALHNNPAIQRLISQGVKLRGTSALSSDIAAAAASEVGSYPSPTPIGDRALDAAMADLATVYQGSLAFRQFATSSYGVLTDPGAEQFMATLQPIAIASFIPPSQLIKLMLPRYQNLSVNGVVAAGLEVFAAIAGMIALVAGVAGFPMVAFVVGFNGGVAGLIASVIHLGAALDCDHDGDPWHSSEGGECR